MIIEGLHPTDPFKYGPCLLDSIMIAFASFVSIYLVIHLRLATDL